MTKNRKLIIFGGGETALLAYEYFTHDSSYEVVSFALDKKYIEEETICGLPVYDVNGIEEYFPPDQYFAFVAVSSSKLNRSRKELYCRVKELGYPFASYISSKSFVWDKSKIGENCFILENNTLQPFSEVGNNVVMWSGNHLGHRSKIKDHCFISSHCVISGFCEIGEFTFMGVNCTVENNVVIDRDNFVGSGAIIRKNTGPKQFYQHDATALSKIDSHRLFKIKE